jgi:hypothetical protein
MKCTALPYESVLRLHYSTRYPGGRRRTRSKPMLNPREGIMVRNLRLALPTAAAVFALMTVPPLLPAPMTAGLSGSALAAVKLNTSRSNIYRTGQTGKPKQGTGHTKYTTVKSAKSNSSDRKIGGGTSGLAGPSAGPAAMKGMGSKSTLAR